MSLSIFWTFLSLLYLFTLLVFFFLSQRGEFSVLYWSKADRDDFYAVLAVISSIIFILTFFGSLSPDPPIPSILFPLLFLSSLSLKSISLFRLLGAYKLSFLFSLCCFLHAVKTIWSKEKEETKEEEIGQILLQWTYSFLSQIPILSFFLPSSPPTLPYFIHYFFVVLSNMGISGWFFIWFHTLLYSLNHYISFMGPRYATKHITKISSFVVLFFSFFPLLLPPSHPSLFPLLFPHHR